MDLLLSATRNIDDYRLKPDGNELSAWQKKGGGGFEPTEGSSGGRRYMNITIKN
jgi:hypothetical protein